MGPIAALQPVDRAASISFVDENTIVAGSTEGYFTVLSVREETNPEIVEISENGPRKHPHPLLKIF